MIPRTVERLLHLRPGDLRIGLPLFLLLFLVMSSYIACQVAADALFLARFQAVQLPYADIAIAILVGLVVAFYIRAAQWVTLRTLLVGSLVVFAGTALLFWWGVHTHQSDWLLPVLYVWIRIFGVLAPSQVWTLANYVLTTREAKRLFGLVGSGAILGGVFGGLLSRLAAELVRTEVLLLVMVFLLTVSAILVMIIWRRRSLEDSWFDPIVPEIGRQGGDPETAQTVPTAPRNLRESIAQVIASPYLQAIAAVVLASSFVTNIASWQFKAIAKEALVDKANLTVFFGNFYFITGMLSLAAQLLLTSRVLRRFGLGPALFIVPVTLLFGSVGVLMLGSLWAVTWLKGSDKVLRYSIDTAAVQLLYLPVPGSVKVQMKSFIDTVVWRLGDGLAGITMLIFATFLGFTPRQVSVVSIALLVAWLVAAYKARKQYVVTLSDSIQQHRLDAERMSAPVLDRSTTDLLALKLRGGDAGEILYALSLFEMGQEHATHPALRALLEHPSAEVRQQAVAILARAGDKAVLPQVQRLLKDEDLNVRTEALLYLSRFEQFDPLTKIQELGDFADFSIRAAMVVFLARPGPTQNVEAARVLLDAMVGEKGAQSVRTRLEAARVLTLLPDDTEPQVVALLQDEDSDVVRQALRAAGKLKKRKLIPPMLVCLADPRLTADAVEALCSFGDRIVGTLKDRLTDPVHQLDIRLEIPNVLVCIGTQSAERALVESLFEADSRLRMRIIGALNKLHHVHPELGLDTQIIETVLAAEIMGHYRSYQVLGKLGEQVSEDDPAVRGLRESMNSEVERIFRLLGLLYPRYDLHSAYFGLQSSDRVVHDNALEFLDNILKPQLQRLVVPLLDSEVSVRERITMANQLLGTSVQSSEEAIGVLVQSDDPWVRSCAAYAIGALRLHTLRGALDQWLEDPDPLLREAARHAKMQLGGTQNLEPRT